MKRVLILSHSGTLAAAWLCLLALGSTAAPAQAGTPPRTELRHLVCQQALDPGQRSVSITAVMRPIAGTRRMSMRFQLLTRPTGSSGYRPVTGGDLGRWIQPSNATLGQRPGDVWILDKQVVGLSGPARYRFRVLFRWIGSRHRVLRTTSASSGICRQAERRADLLVRRVTVYLTHRSGVERYVAVIANAGGTAAGPFQVWFSPGGGAPVVSRTVPRLGPHASAKLQFQGPACSSSAPPTVTADPTRQVDESNRVNNSLTVSCARVQPAPSG